MSDETPAEVAAETPGKKPETDWERRRRIARVFGDVLPETTSDERDADSSPSDGDSASDAWLKRQVPPHHGG